jgi:glutathione S-transferase
VGGGVKLYDNPFSPYAFKVRAALYDKGIAFEKHEIKTQADRATLLALNPRGEVPALVDGDTIVCDSKVICAYLEERFPQPALLPGDVAGRARARYLELKSDTEIDGCTFVLGIVKISRPALTTDVPGALLRAEEALARHYAYLERELAGREWFLGDFSLVDVALAPHVKTAAFMGYPPGSTHPALDAWLARVSKRACGRSRLSLAHSLSPAGEVDWVVRQPEEQ